MCKFSIPLSLGFLLSFSLSLYLSVSLSLSLLCDWVSESFYLFERACVSAADLHSPTFQ